MIVFVFDDIAFAFSMAGFFFCFLYFLFLDFTKLNSTKFFWYNGDPYYIRKIYVGYIFISLEYSNVILQDSDKADPSTGITLSLCSEFS